MRDLLYRLYEKRLAAKLAGGPLPAHVGVMVDGNRRWAKDMGFVNPNDGHREGAEHIKRLLRWCDEAGVRHVTIWLLSTENMGRPAVELEPLLQIIQDLAVELAEAGQPWRLRTIGALDLLPAHHASAIKRAAESTVDRTDGAVVNLAICYGGHREITDAVRALLHEYDRRGKTLHEVADELEAQDIADHLYLKDQPAPDLLIRTSGEQRLSGFLLWQSAYSEFYFCDLNWPDFRRVDFLRALRSYSSRQRRYGV
ncbi:Undecaprenyl pyrophosphate synthetase [Stackebrandtia albiflava]|uniref:Isoprenyl transferase n=1 Tax=Stackebrandtia albiflava TaxID=406432 RepID=A0A562UPJ5_9ACTN|nr:isoprenyl transferase [Stackebrandtia albiflava]TWJ07543.1 Undecaprenyl pyrophosphate synthetase [Stackebrandtia albiflava]